MSSIEDLDYLDCIVIGAGVAGLSGALVLGRARRRLLVIDAGEQSNLAADGIGGLLGSDRRPPAELYAKGRSELEAYPSIEFRHDRVVSAAISAGDGFEVETQAGLTARASTLLLAPGMEYRYPEVPGIAERWGHTAFHCPFCHGWEVAGRRLGFLGDPEGAERGLLLRAWSDDVTVFTNGREGIGEAARERLDAAGVTIDDRVIARLEGPGRDLESIGFTDGSERPLGGLLVQTELHQRSGLATSLGLRLAAPTPVVQDPVKVDGRMAGSVPGIFAAGDAAAQMPSIQNAIAAGAMAAAGVVHELTITRAPQPARG